jgi:hypothetical protein
MIVEEQRIVSESWHGDTSLCQIVQVLQHRNLNYIMEDILTVTTSVLILVRFHIQALITPLHTHTHTKVRFHIKVLITPFHTCMHAPTHPRARARAHTHTHTHTPYVAADHEKCSQPSWNHKQDLPHHNVDTTQMCATFVPWKISRPRF